MQKEPNFFIIGAPKCGTTSMIHYLSQHPSIFVSPVKEPHFFNTDSTHRYFFTTDTYLSLFNEAKPQHSIICEGSVWYLYSEKAIDNILSFNPNAKFLVMLRNPVDMFFSLHQELLFGGSENEKSAAKAWKLQTERKKGNKIPSGCSDPKLLQYRDACKLGFQVKRALTKIKPNNIFFVRLDELKINPDKVYNNVLDFLEILPKSLESYEVVNPKKMRKFPLLSRFFIHFTQLKKSLGIKGGFGLASAINKRNVSYNKEINSIEKRDLENELQAYFYEDICLLETLLNKDLTHWKN